MRWIAGGNRNAGSVSGEGLADRFPNAGSTTRNQSDSSRQHHLIAFQRNCLFPTEFLLKRQEIVRLLLNPRGKKSFEPHECHGRTKGSLQKSVFYCIITRLYFIFGANRRRYGHHAATYLWSRAGGVRLSSELRGAAYASHQWRSEKVGLCSLDQGRGPFHGLRHHERLPAKTI